MNKSELVRKSLISALYVLAYIAIVSFVMTNGEQIFGGQEPENSVLAGVAILLLFVLSAVVVGSAIFLKPAMMFMDGQKKEALKLLTQTIGWLVVFTVAVLVFLSWL